MNTIEHRVKEVVALELETTSDKLNNTDDLMEISEMDSLTLVEIVMSLEEEFDTLMPDSDIETVRTLQDLIDLCERKVSQES